MNARKILAAVITILSVDRHACQQLALSALSIFVNSGDAKPELAYVEMLKHAPGSDIMALETFKQHFAVGRLIQILFSAFADLESYFEHVAFSAWIEVRLVTKETGFRDLVIQFIIDNGGMTRQQAIALRNDFTGKTSNGSKSKSGKAETKSGKSDETETTEGSQVKLSDKDLAEQLASKTPKQLAKILGIVLSGRKAKQILPVLETVSSVYETAVSDESPDLQIING